VEAEIRHADGVDVRVAQRHAQARAALRDVPLLARKFAPVTVYDLLRHTFGLKR
jgi:hypothetical protein